MGNFHENLPFLGPSAWSNARPLIPVSRPVVVHPFSLKRNKCVPGKKGNGTERVGALFVHGEAYFNLRSLDV
jgi:hypothetical protein